ncbi:MAG: hypothetical protein RL204_628 [Bacteroidota bacterium]|jgi:hypothetical protein
MNSRIKSWGLLSLQKFLFKKIILGKKLAAKGLLSVRYDFEGTNKPDFPLERLNSKIVLDAFKDRPYNLFLFCTNINGAFTDYF